MSDQKSELQPEEAEVGGGGAPQEGEATYVDSQRPPDWFREQIALCAGRSRFPRRR